MNIAYYKNEKVDADLSKALRTTDCRRIIHQHLRCIQVATLSWRNVMPQLTGAARKNWIVRNGSPVIQDSAARPGGAGDVINI
ncbi:hypothetical protein ACTMU2_21540 [Cupriavidus basilensis]